MKQVDPQQGRGVGSQAPDGKDASPLVGCLAAWLALLCGVGAVAAACFGRWWLAGGALVVTGLLWRLKGEPDPRGWRSSRSSMASTKVATGTIRRDTTRDGLGGAPPSAAARQRRTARAMGRIRRTAASAGIRGTGPIPSRTGRCGSWRVTSSSHPRSLRSRSPPPSAAATASKGGAIRYRHWLHWAAERKATPPRRHAATPPRRHAATPPRRHAATPRRRHAATPPRRHAATPPRRHAATPRVSTCR
jgi:hypothetical protein